MIRYAPPVDRRILRDDIEQGSTIPGDPTHVIEVLCEEFHDGTMRLLSWSDGAKSGEAANGEENGVNK